MEKLCSMDRHYDFLALFKLVIDLKTWISVLSELSVICVVHRANKKCVEELLTFPTLSHKYS